MSIENAISARLDETGDGTESLANVIKEISSSGPWTDEERCAALIPLALRSRDRSAIFQVARWLWRAPGLAERAMEILREIAGEDPATARLLVGNLLLEDSPVSAAVRESLKGWPAEPALQHVASSADPGEAVAAQLESADPEQVAVALGGAGQCSCLPPFGDEILTCFGEAPVPEEAQLRFVELMCKFQRFEPPLTDEQRCSALAAFAVRRAGSAALAEIAAWLRTSEEPWLEHALRAIAAAGIEDERTTRRARDLLAPLLTPGSPVGPRAAQLLAGWLANPALLPVIKPLAAGLLLHLVDAGDAVALRELLATRPEIDLAVDARGFSALHCAIQRGDAELVRCLVDAGADPDLPVQGDGPQAGFSALQLAASHGADAVCAVLLEAGARTDAEDPHRHRRSLLHLAAAAGSENVINELAAAGLDLCARNQIGSHPLHTAARRGNTAAIDALIAAGAPLDAQNDYGKTPLHYAAEEGRLDAVQRLIAAGARTDVRDEGGELPADVARTAAIQRCLGAAAETRGGDPLRRWLREALAFYRKLHFFSEHAELSDDALIDHLQQTSGPLNTAMQDADLGLLVRDRERVWVADYYGPEIGSPVSADAQRYREALRAFSTIGRGKISFSRIREQWTSPRGPISVSFDVSGRQHVLSPEYVGELFDIGFVADLNRTLRTGRLRYALYRPAYMELWGACFILLSETEQRELEQVRGCRFYSPEELAEERAALRALAVEDEQL